MGGHDSLKTPPDNLKDAIDWLALVGGYGKTGWGSTGKYNELKNALQALPNFEETFSSTFNGISSPESFVKQVTENLGSGFLGYDGQNSTDFNGSVIVKKVGSKYQSAYYGGSWVQGSVNDYAKTFLFLAPLVYYLVSFLYWACKTNWKNKTIQSSGSGSSLFYLFNAMGYFPSQLNEKKNGDTIASALDDYNGFPELSAAYGSGRSSSYETFLSTLETNGPKNALSYPLTNCKIFSYAYLKSKQNGKDITDAIDKIKDELKSISTSGDISNTGNVSALKDKIRILLTKIQNFNLNSGSSGSGSASTWNPGSSEPGSDGPRKPGSSGTPSASQTPASSSAGAVAGTLTTLGLGGGAAAA